ncbi:MAG: helix-turn-helix domain-containing protein [Dehalococcoidia bacterium]
MVADARPFGSLRGETEQLADRLRELGRNPDFVAEGLALGVIEQALAIMQSQGISRSALATRMGVSRAYISRIFDAPPNLTLRSIAALALALDTSPLVDLVGDSPTRTDYAQQQHNPNLR